jgi:hypothetical protein
VHREVFLAIQKIIASARAHLKKGEALAAKMLLVDLMNAIPPPKHLNNPQHLSFWKSLPLNDIEKWNALLYELQEMAFEAALRSGTYPLKPHEVFPFHTSIPLILYILFDRLIPYKTREFDRLWTQGLGKEPIRVQLENSKNRFIDMRTEEIVKEVTDDLQKGWTEEDRQEAKEMREFEGEMFAFRARQLFNRVTGTVSDEDEPVKPFHADPSAKAAQRKTQLETCIDRAKNTDQFLSNLRAIDTKVMNWDGLISGFMLPHCPRSVAVMGCFAKIIDIPLELLAYKIGRKNWVSHAFFGSHSSALLLMENDRSLVLGSSPGSDKLFCACQDALEELLQGARVVDRSPVSYSLLIGYNGKGDGTRFGTSAKEQEKAQDLRTAIKRAHGGFFNLDEGSKCLVPVPLATFRKIIEMRKVLVRPEVMVQKVMDGTLAVLSTVFGGETLTDEQVQKRFREMSQICLVAGKGANYTLSSSSEHTGTLEIRFSDKERPPTTEDRWKWLGHATHDQCNVQVGGDDEPKEFGIAYHDRLFSNLDLVQEFILRVSALATASNSEKLSYLAITQCFHFIYHYSEMLANPEVQHTIYKTFFQQGLIRELLQKHPQFFIENQKLLDEICKHLQSKHDHLKSELFLREVFERIRRQAWDLAKSRSISNECAKAVSEALPPYDSQHVLNTCVAKVDDNSCEEQKEFSQHVLAFYWRNWEDRANNRPDVFPNLQDISAWGAWLNALAVMHTSPLEQGHSGWQAELLHNAHITLLPYLGGKLEADLILRNQLLHNVSGRDGNWQPVAGKVYCYALPPPQEGGENFEVDLSTGKNFKISVVSGKTGKLPPAVLGDEAVYKFLFQDANPTVLIQRLTGSAITEYSWLDEESGIKFTILYHNTTHAYQIFQTVENQKFQFHKLALSKAGTTPLWELFARHSNKTIENLVNRNGVWIPIDSKGTPNLSRALVAQYNKSLTQDPITLDIQGNKIRGATVGTGQEKMHVCSALANRNAILLTCRDGNDLLLLSKTGDLVDEIRIPLTLGVKGAGDQLILQRDPKNPSRWIVKGKEGWELKLVDTKTYEERFGENWRLFVLPLTNGREDEFWIFTHMIGNPSKKGQKTKILRSALDYVEMVGGTCTDMGVIKDVDLKTVQMAVGAMEHLAGGAGNLVGEIENLAGNAHLMRIAGLNAINGEDHDGENEGEESAGQKQINFVEMLKTIITPPPIRYRCVGRTESSSHAGFFFLAWLAAKRGEWATASCYLNKMVDSGHSSLAEVKLFQEIITRFLGVELAAELASIVREMQNRNHDHDVSTPSLLPPPKSPMETAFRAKLLYALIVIHTQLKGALHVDLLSSEYMAKIAALGGQEAREALQATSLLAIFQQVGAYLLVQYRMMLAANSAQLHEQFADHGLLLAKHEEQILGGQNQDAEHFVSALMLATQPPPLADSHTTTSYELKIPDETAVRKMVEFMSTRVSPNGVFSIHAMHKALGTYPKWETVIAHFWDYWDWIRHEILDMQDIAFLLRDLPKNLPHHDEVDTARRLLLCLWYFEKNSANASFRDDVDSPQASDTNEIQNIRLRMLDMAYLTKTRDECEQEATMAPTWWRVGLAWGFKALVTFLDKQNTTYAKKIGGIPHKGGAQHEFTTCSMHVLIQFLGRALQGQRSKGHLLTIKGLVQTPPSYALALPNPPPVPHQEERKKTMKEVEGHLASVLGPMAALGLARDLMFQRIITGGLHLPFEIFWQQLKQGFIEVTLRNNPLFRAFLSEDKIEQLRLLVQKTHRDYARAIGLPVDPYPKHVEKGEYQSLIEVRPPEDRPDWEKKYFEESSLRWNTCTGSMEHTTSSVWEEQRALVHARFNPESRPNTDARGRKRFQRICDSADAAKNDLEKRTQKSFNVTQVKPLQRELSARLEVLRQDEEEGIKAVLNFALTHSSELGIMHFFADPGRFTPAQILDKILDLYCHGQLGLLNDPAVRRFFAEMITETLLIATERQQYEKALMFSKTLTSTLKKLVTRVPPSKDVYTRVQMLQTVANQSVDWILCSAELKRCLQEGGNRLRYTYEKDGRHYMDDGVFAYRYLVSDYRNRWISRVIAMKALEALARSLYTREEGKEEPIRFIQLKMGAGKSDFLFPELVNILIHGGWTPVMVATDALLGELSNSLIKEKVFPFTFSIDFGLQPGASDQEIEAHLKNLLVVFHNLKAEKKVVLTSPSQIAALHDKRVHLQELLKLKPGPEREGVFKQLQLLKQIEGCLKHSNVRYVIDEDVNYDNSREYNFATGEYRTVDTIRFNVAERLVYLMKDADQHPDRYPPGVSGIWKKVIHNDMRAIQNVKTFIPLVQAIFRDTDFWVSVGWNKADWEKINQDEFVAYILGMCPEPPKEMEKWNPDLPEDEQQEKIHVAALKTYFTKAILPVISVNPRLERGLSATNGVTVVPYNDGVAKENVLYGEESEIILHHIFHYMGTGNTISEKVFGEKWKDLAGLDIVVSPHFSATWREWSSAITEVKKKHSEKYISLYAAFRHAPELAWERFQFLRYLMLHTHEVRVFVDQISFNSQDLGVGTDVRLASGTGNGFALNLSTGAQDVDLVLGETLLCASLDTGTTTFPNDGVSEHILKRVQEIHDPSKQGDVCRVILNYDYDVKTDVIVPAIHDGSETQVIFRKNDVKHIWRPNHPFADDYDPESIESDALFFYNRNDARGLHFNISRIPGHYGDALVGVGNKIEDVAQLLWRQRYLGLGHRVKMSHDENTAHQIRLCCNLPPDTRITTGHAMLYFVENALTEDDIKNVKAVICKLAAIAKANLEPVLRTPYELTGLGINTSTGFFEDLEGHVICRTTRELNILTNKNNWAREYAPQQMADSLAFMHNVHKKEIGKIEQMRNEFIKSLTDFIKEKEEGDPAFALATFSWRRWIEDVSHLSPQEFESALGDRLLGHEGDTMVYVRELLRKAYGIYRGLNVTLEAIKFEKNRLDHDSKYQKFLTENLPTKIPLDDDVQKGREQQVQQVQQQQQQQQQVKQERVYTPVDGVERAPVVDYPYFKAVINGSVTTYPMSTRIGKHDYYRFAQNGNFLPLSTILYEGHGVMIQKDFFKDMYISHRAWSLLKKMGCNGAPVVELLFMTTKNGTCHTMIITPTEREEKVADHFCTERSTKAQPKQQQASTAEATAIYALLNAKFSYLVMDVGVKQPKQEAEEWIEKMMRNKLFLNWSQFSLEEIGMLTDVIRRMDPSELSLLMIQLHTVGSTDIPHILQMICKSNSDSDWVYKTVRRKIDVGYETFSDDEEKAFIKWIKNETSVNIAVLCNNLRLKSSQEPDVKKRRLLENMITKIRTTKDKIKEEQAVNKMKKKQTVISTMTQRQIST